MGTAKPLKSHKSRTSTIIGTAHYMAPEIIGGKSYTMSVDFWSAGVVLYEFMAGKLPYGENSSDPFQLYEEIISSSLEFPQFMRDKRVRNFLTNRLLNKNPEGRAPDGFESIKANIWFSDFDWV